MIYFINNNAGVNQHQQLFQINFIIPIKKGELKIHLLLRIRIVKMI